MAAGRSPSRLQKSSMPQWSGPCASTSKRCISNAWPSLETSVLAMGMTRLATCMHRCSFKATKGRCALEPLMMWWRVTRLAICAAPGVRLLQAARPKVWAPRRRRRWWRARAPVQQTRLQSCRPSAAQPPPPAWPVRWFSARCGHPQVAHHVAPDDRQQGYGTGADMRAELLLQHLERIPLRQVHLQQHRREVVVPYVTLCGHQHGERHEVVSRHLRVVAEHALEIAFSAQRGDFAAQHVHGQRDPLAVRAR